MPDLTTPATENLTNSEARNDPKQLHGENRGRKVAHLKTSPVFLTQAPKDDSVVGKGYGICRTNLACVHRYKPITIGGSLVEKTVTHLLVCTCATQWLHTHHRVGESIKIITAS